MYKMNTGNIELNWYFDSNQIIVFISRVAHRAHTFFLDHEIDFELRPNRSIAIFERQNI